MVYLRRGILGMPEVPVLKELNDIRDNLERNARETNSPNTWDMTVHDRGTFNEIANAVLPEGKYTAQDIEDAYLQLHLISEFGGATPHMGVRPTTVNQGPNADKYLLVDIPASELEKRVDDNRSRLGVANAFLRNWQMLPARDSTAQRQDSQAALERFIATTNKKGDVGQGLYQFGNSGYRHNKPADSSELKESYTQNLNDKGRGFDRLSRDRIVNQPTEFGHNLAAENGGSDTPGNGRMQAKPANRATGKFDGVLGALRALGPKYKENKKFIEEAAGEKLLPLLYY